MSVVGKVNGARLAAIEEFFADLDIKHPVEPSKPCSARLGHGSWCVAPTDHEGDHVPGASPTYGPIEERPELWRRHKGYNR